ncbi:hypothetical protein [Citrobacter sp. RHB25-C09]|uniref:hypothetical protein n=1 Tax=Citrobacter sp. RHB25-C09 TaxID=2742624 RepID=UPI0015EF004F|nr:hypothetical protein [Citrobacter sp. RHB25-C09]QMI05832.1 hypothetical protein HVY19_13550 [Citrobacter sp. RHB25-C09]
MAMRKFSLTVNSYDKHRALSDIFKHYLDHDLNVSYVPGTRETQVIVEADEDKSPDDIFGGPNGEFIGIFHIEEIF